MTPATVAEQMLYEIGDPRAYHVPDVACDFTGVRFEADGADRVRVSGAKGRPPTDTYKVSATFMDGYRNAAFLTIAGEQAAAKARRTGEALFKRMARMLGEQGLPPFSETRIEVIGAEDMYGANARPDSREVVLKMAAKAPSRASLELFAREFAAGRHVDGAGHHRAGRRAAEPGAGDPAVLVPAAQARTRRRRADRRRRHGRRRAGARRLRRQRPRPGTERRRGAGGVGQPPGVADPAGARTFRRQGRQGEHRRARAQARVPAVAAPVADARARGRALRAQRPEPCRPLRPAAAATR